MGYNDSQWPKRGLRRRDFFRFGLTASALSWLTGSCKRASKPGTITPKDPPPPEPIYELTEGDALYDDFDGNGNYQSYDNRNLAEAGRLSSKLWLAYVGSEVVPGDAADTLFVCVDESGRRVEYAPLEEPVRELIADLAENPIPITAPDREALSSLLLGPGRAAAADMETKPLQEQIQVIQYLLSQPHENFNERGRKLVKIITEAKPAASLREGLAAVARLARDESDLYIWSRLLAHQQFFEKSRASLFRMPSREAPQEIEYVFDAQGRLTTTSPHVPGQPYHAPHRLLVVGQKDALWDTGRGSIAIEKGKIYSSAQVVPSARNGYILQMTNKMKDAFTRCLLNNPPELGFADFRSFSADVMLSSASTSLHSSAGLDYHTTIPEQPPGKSWLAQVVIVRNTAGNVVIMGSTTNINLGTFCGDLLGPAQMDRWYNLRLDIVTNSRDDRLGPEELRLDYYLDGVLKASRIPEDSPILVDPNRIGWGPQRSFVVASENSEGDSIACFDNVRAVYRNRTG